MKFHDSTEDIFMFLLKSSSGELQSPFLQILVLHLFSFLFFYSRPFFIISSSCLMDNLLLGFSIFCLTDKFFFYRIFFFRDLLHDLLLDLLARKIFRIELQLVQLGFFKFFLLWSSLCSFSRLSIFKETDLRRHSFPCLI